MAIRRRTIEDYKFFPKIERECIVEQIREYFEENGPTCNAVIGISGGKDSTIAAALCAEALGSNRVIGVMLPYAGQETEDAERVINLLGIKKKKIDITDIYDAAIDGLEQSCNYVIEQSRINLLPRIRMTMLMGIAQSSNGRLICTSNESERYMGYFTMYGDECGTCKPLINYTVTELRQIGHVIDYLPNELIDKTPSDDISGNTDEEAFGVSYEVIDNHIRLGKDEPGNEYFNKTVSEIHAANLFKINPKEPRDTLGFLVKHYGFHSR